MRTLLTFLIAFTGLAVLFAGPFVLLPAIGAVEGTYGSAWGGAALASAFVVCAGAMWALSRLADHRSAYFDAPAGKGPVDRLFCAACGRAAGTDAVICAACGSTRFALRPPMQPTPPAPQPVPTPLGLVRERSFGLLWVGQLVSLFGDMFLLVALPYHVYERTGSALATGAMFAAQMAPRVVLTSAAGALVDRWDRRRTMVVADVVRAALLLPLIAVDWGNDLWVVYVLTAAQTAAGAFFAPARAALLPLLVPSSRRVAANALNGLTVSIASLVAAPLGGLLLAWLGLPAVVGLDTISFLVSAVCIACIAVPVSRAAGEVTRDSKHESAPTPAGLLRRTWADWLEGVQIVGREPRLSALVGLNGLVFAGMGITAALFVVFMRERFGGGPIELGWWLSGQGAGTLVAGLFVARLRRAELSSRLVAAALVLRGALLVAQLLVPSLWAAIFFASVSMAGGVVYTVGTQTLAQNLSTDRHRGRVFGLLDSTTAVSMLAGTLLARAFGDATGAVPLFAATALLWLAAGFIAWRHLGGAAQPAGQPPTYPSPAREARDDPPSLVQRGPRPGFSLSPA